MGGAGTRLAATAICLLIAGAASPGSASAAEPGFHRLARTTTPDPVLTDGVRWAAYRVPGGRTHVIDDRTGASYTVATPAKCGVAAVGHGLLMWQCHTPPGRYSDNPDHPALFDLVHRRRVPVAGFQALQSDFDAQVAGGPNEDQGSYDLSFSDVGRAWLGGLYDISQGNISHDTFGVFALNWHTGERRYDRPRKATEWPNFDSAGLAQPLCSPLHRVIDQGYDQRIFLDFGYERGYGVTNNWGLNKVLLERCGRQPIVLDRCDAGDCDLWQLGAGMVTWQRGRTVMLYDIARRRRRAFRQRGFGGVVWPQHTRRSIFVSVSAGSRWRLYSRRL